jgi:hypothetical protein
MTKYKMDMKSWGDPATKEGRQRCDQKPIVGLSRRFHKVVEDVAGDPDYCS